jgi:hypothetical protein
MQFDADHIFALAGYAVADPDIMENHVRNGVPAIAEREYADTIEVLRMFKGDAEWAQPHGAPGRRATMTPSNHNAAQLPSGTVPPVVGGLNDL